MTINDKTVTICDLQGLIDLINYDIRVENIRRALQTCTDPKRAAYLREAYRDLLNNKI